MNHKQNHVGLSWKIPPPLVTPPLTIRNVIAFFLLLLIVFLLYSNTYNCSWHFDDYNIITNNSLLHIENLQFESIKRSFYAQPVLQRLYRPIPMLTFAINWYANHETMWGFHLINNIIHLLTAFFLFLAIQSMLATPVAKERGPYDVYFIALMSAVFWAVNPIQTQAVTYIVQRMAAMAAMFYVLSIYFYLKARMARSYRKMVFFWGGCLLSGLAAYFSKTNAAMLPLSLVLIEVVFFRDLYNIILNLYKTKPYFIWSLIAIIVSTSILVCWVFHETINDTILWSYQQRPFTIIERLMTEPRVLVFYLSQIIYPAHHRLAIHHIFPVSHSLFDPFTTLLCIILIIALIVFSIVKIKKLPFISFAILFFFLNHIIESSIIGLELVFEHRNYLPSLFLFFPISVLACSFLQWAYKHKYNLFLISGFFIVCLIVFTGMVTYARNMDWRSEKTLWEDVLHKYPNSTRAMHNLAHGYYQKRGNDDAALTLYKLILSRNWQDGSAEFRTGLTLNNIATIYFYKGLDEAALDFWNQALAIHPRLNSARIGKVRALIGLGRWNDASESINDALLSGGTPTALNLKAFILLKQERYDEAIPYLQSALKIDPLNRDSMIYLSAVYSKLKRYKKSRIFLNFSKSIHTADARMFLMLLEDAILRHDHTATQNFLNQISNPEIQADVLKALRASKGREGIPLMLGEIVPLIASQVNSNTNKWVHSIEDLIGDTSP